MPFDSVSSERSYMHDNQDGSRQGFEMRQASESFPGRQVGADTLGGQHLERPTAHQRHQGMLQQHLRYYFEGGDVYVKSGNYSQDSRPQVMGPAARFPQWPPQFSPQPFPPARLPAEYNMQHQGPPQIPYGAVYSPLGHGEQVFGDTRYGNQPEMAGSVDTELVRSGEKVCDI